MSAIHGDPGLPAPEAATMVSSTVIGKTAETVATGPGGKSDFVLIVRQKVSV